MTIERVVSYLGDFRQHPGFGQVGDALGRDLSALELVVSGADVRSCRRTCLEIVSPLTDALGLLYVDPWSSDGVKSRSSSPLQRLGTRSAVSAQVDGWREVLYRSSNGVRWLSSWSFDRARLEDVESVLHNARSSWLIVGGDLEGLTQRLLSSELLRREFAGESREALVRLADLGAEFGCSVGYLWGWFDDREAELVVLGRSQVVMDHVATIRATAFPPVGAVDRHHG